ncbi:hypothetical protein EHQ31_04865 [Leptospira montravelensis]|uniref:Sec region non-globular protein n=1 Tax=Leptospira montravelensis TaxID=2484961 RepID=A0ABY2LZ21_9LEPT|nr:SRP-less Sec system protein [Leptospira montravelensis]TGK84029.1 hypothetical protein EHQ19_05830 [Leptospira montravelensis]TGL06037.1 hypothetical protein EHQ31_04865 [Leptospira montravelensis]
MKRLFFISFTICFSVSLLAQEGLDFLDKVNDKPKSNTTKPKEETSVTSTKKQTNVVTATGTTTGKKKRSKKKSKQNQLTQETLPQNTSLVSNPNTAVPVTEKSIPAIEKQPIVVEEEEVVSNGLWMDSIVSVEPTGLPGFAGDLKMGKTESNESVPTLSTNKETGKSLFNFSDFFAKYKKAMMILGIIILFAFYRLRSARPGSSSRSYRR